MTLEEQIAAFLAEDEARKPSVGKRPNSYQSNTNLINEVQPGTLLGAVNQNIQPEVDTNMWQEIVRNAA